MRDLSFLLCLLCTASVLAEVEPSKQDTIPEVVVTGSRTVTDVRHLPQTLTIVDREQLTAHHRSNILPTLSELVPNMMVTQRGVMGYGLSTGGTGGMMLRGISSSAGQVMVLVDGHPQYNGIYGHSIADSYHTMMAEGVEVLRGPASVLYGSNAMGGVVNIVTRRMPQDGVRTTLDVGAGSYGTFQAEAANQLRRGRFTSDVSAQYGRSDNHRPNMGFQQYGGQIKLGYRFSSHWSAFAEANITHFSAQYPGTINAPMQEAEQWITRGVMSMGVDNQYDRTSGRLSVYDNFGRHKINDGYKANGGTPQSRLFRSRDALVGVSWYQSVRAWSGARLTAGMDYQHIYGHAFYTSRSTGEVLETPNKQSGQESNEEVAAYVQLSQELWQCLTMDAGIRYDHHTVTGGQWIPQVGIVYRPLADGQIRAMASRGFRNPTMREMYLYPPSNTELSPESMWSYELSWRQALAQGRLSYGVTAYYIHARNIIQTVAMQNVNTGELRNSGVEVEARWQVNRHWTLQTNHSYLHMQNPVLAAPGYKGYLAASMHYGRWALNAGLTQIAGMYTVVGANPKRENCTLLAATLSYQACSWVGLWLRGDNLLAQRYQYVDGMPMPRATVMAGVTLGF